MRLGQFTTEENDEPWAGAVVEDEVVHLREAGAQTGISLPQNLRALMSEWEWQSKAESSYRMLVRKDRDICQK